MSEMENPYAGPFPVTQVSTSDRIAFLRKTYSLVLLGIVVFAATISASADVSFIQNLAAGLWASPWIAIIVLLGSAFAVRALARTPGIGLVGYLAYAFLLGLFLAQPVYHAGGDVTRQAGVLTFCIFSGLTAYVFVTKKDFSFLGGILGICLFAMIGIAICGLLFGIQMGTWFSVLGAMLFSGYILYDTSKIMKQHSPSEALPAAIELFVDIVMLFWYLLSLFNRE
ncbi:MAG: Bax inhibitor-1 family protein [Planctomycetota bacterium]